MNEIETTLLKSVAKITNKEHIRNIKTTQKEIAEGICPRCGGKLINREGKYGKFIGCENYPNCKFILKQQERI